MFSVVIPIYNNGKTVVQSLISVLAQDFQRFEIIVVDDGSTDDGAETIAAHLSDPRIRVVRQPQSGAGAARNRGVDLSRYDLIAFLDADDIFLPGYLAEMKQLADDYPEAAMYCCAGFIRYPNGSGYIRSAARYHGRNSIVNYFENPYFFSHTSATVVRKANFYASGGFPLRMRGLEDLVCFFNIATQSIVAFCPKPLSLYNHSPSRWLDRGEGSVPHSSGAGAELLRTEMVKKYNAVFNHWAHLPPEDRDDFFLKFALLDIRHALRLSIAAGERTGVQRILDTLEPGLVDQFGRLEQNLYRRPGLRWFALAVLTGHALVWRARCYPRAIYTKSLDAFLGNAERLG